MLPFAFGPDAANLGYKPAQKISRSDAAATRRRPVLGYNEPAMLTEYRQRFRDFHVAMTREEYLFRSGRKQRAETAHFFSEYSDLFTRLAAAELRAALEATSEHFETERDAIRRLITFALEGHLAARARALSEEIRAVETEGTIQWDGQTLGFHESAAVLADEPAPARRRELYARRAEVIKRAQDLRAERIERQRETARELGYQHELALYGELRGVDYAGLAARLTPFLNQTESKYVSALSPFVAREAAVALEEAQRADLGYVEGLRRFDPFFPHERLSEVYRATFAGLGINTDRQPNIEVEAEARPRSSARAFCALIRIPDEIKLVVNPAGGQASYQAFLRAAGQAQHGGWTSRHLHTEFQYGGDRAVSETYAALFGQLLLDERWLAEPLGFSESAAFRRALALCRLIEARRRAAQLSFEVELRAGKLRGAAGPRYAELLTEAVRVRYDETEHLSDLDAAFRAADCLRAWALEAQLREHLKARFGHRWWASRKAGEMLIDLWNTGNRYSAEGLAALIGLGDISFDWLASELLTQVSA
jgi:hypothetical protein